jgi:short-subunit dehydrogenase
MADRSYGRIINVSSIAAFAPPQRGSLYSASKSFVVHMSQGLAAELSDRNVNVTALCPGFTHTEFHKVMGVEERVRRSPRFLWMSAREVAEQGVEAVMSGRTVYINGWINRLLTLLCRFAPASLIQSRRPKLSAKPPTPSPR